MARAILPCLTLLLLLSPFHELLVLLWRPLGAWDDLTEALLWIALVGLTRPCPLTRPLAAVAAVTVASALLQGAPPTQLRSYLLPPAIALACARLEQDQLSRLRGRWLVMASWVGVFGVVSFAAFRLCGGGPHLRPEPPNALLKLLSFPYYCGVYPRGWRLIGPFLNDNYCGMWCAALLMVALAARPRGWPGILLLLTNLAWSASRAASLGFLTALGLWSALRERRALGLIPLALAVALPLALQRDFERFLSPFQSEGGRIASLQRAGQSLHTHPWLGQGPASCGLADVQVAKTAIELGSLGLLAYAWVFTTALVHGLRDPARQGWGCALLGLGVASLGADLLEVPQMAILTWAVCGLCVNSSQPDAAVEAA